MSVLWQLSREEIALENKMNTVNRYCVGGLLMKRVGKPVFFVVVGLIFLLTYAAFFGISSTYGDVTKTYIKGADQIRWGIDIRGGVDVTFTPPEGVDATDEEMAAAESVIKLRLVGKNITDYEVYTDYSKDRIIVRYPWKEDETDFNPEKAVKELGETALLTFRYDYPGDQNGKLTDASDSNLILTGKDVEEAYASTDESRNYVVALKLTSEGAKKFSVATQKQLPTKGTISIWMDDVLVSAPSVNAHITDGQAVISGNFTLKEAKEMADKINAGALPFKLETQNYNSISPTLGLGAKDVMVTAGFIAFALVCVFITVLYRLPGLVASIALVGQVAGTIAAITKLFPVFDSFTLTLPGIAGIILSIGIGVDANIITAERIREELAAGKSLDTSIEQGFRRGFPPILDSNITMIIVAVILMGAFGPPSSIFAKLLNVIFFMFGPSTAGAIYSFGYTLLMGVILNFVMGVFCSRLMLRSISRFKPFRNPWLYGGEKQ